MTSKIPRRPATTAPDRKAPSTASPPSTLTGSPHRSRSTADLLDVQRSAGNAAAATVARPPEPTVQRQDVASELEFWQSVQTDPSQAVRYLAQRGAAETAVLAESLDLAQCESLLGAVPASLHDVRAVLLDRAFWLARDSYAWSAAARFLNGFNQADVARRLPADPEELKLLAKGARNALGGGSEYLLGPIRAALKVKPGQLFGKFTTTFDPKNGVPSTLLGGGGVWCTFKATIRFDPDPDIVDAESIEFVQTITRISNDGAIGDDVRPDIKARLNDQLGGVDRGKALKGGSYSGYYGKMNDGTSRMTDLGGANRGQTKPNTKPAEMTDIVESDASNVTIQFETSVVCTAGPDIGLIYGVLQWGFVVGDDRQIISKHHPAEGDIPSAGFGTAVEAWNKQATGKDPVHPQQQVLPPMR